jgi:RNA polymerase sigma-70 factor (ECF subfamily)
MGVFATTRWSMILAAREDTPDARTALERLCRCYRPAVLAYVRGSGYPRADAEDLTQGFFARFLEKRVHAAADPARGRFRVFLRTALHNFLANNAEYESAACRRAPLPASGRDPEDLADGPGGRPEQAYERAWALTVVERAKRRLRRESIASGKEELYRRLEPFVLEAPVADDYARIAADLGTRPNTIAVATHRLRQRLRELIEKELSMTVADMADVESEYATVVATLGARS